MKKYVEAYYSLSSIIRDQLNFKDVEDVLKTFADAPEELLKRFETALRKEVRLRLKSEHDKNYYKTRAEGLQADAVS